MEAEHWILFAVTIGLALAVGFIGGRMSAPKQRRVEAMEKERDAAREEAEAIRAEVNRHFEESARMFGKLASDYRGFFQQFAQTAQNLGLSEGRARELLQQAEPSLVAGDVTEEPVHEAGSKPAAPAAATSSGQEGGTEPADDATTPRASDTGDPATPGDSAAPAADTTAPHDRAPTEAPAGDTATDEEPERADAPGRRDP